MNNQNSEDLHDIAQSAGCLVLCFAVITMCVVAVTLSIIF